MDAKTFEELSCLMYRRPTFEGDFVSIGQWALWCEQSLLDVDLATGRAKLWFSLDNRVEPPDDGSYHYWSCERALPTELLNEFLLNFHDLDVAQLVDCRTNSRDGYSAYVVGRRGDLEIEFRASNADVVESPVQTRLLALVAMVTRTLFGNVRHLGHFPYRLRVAAGESRPGLLRLVEETD